MSASAAISPDPALVAYELLAPFYDAFTAEYDHAAWVAELESAARRHGLSGRRALDVACGTGKSFLPLAERGWQITACDLSPAMVMCAARKVQGRPARVVVADMRALPDLGRFDLVTCLDDAVNYLTERGDLVLALRSMSRALRPGGVLVFDTNTLATYRTAFAAEHEADSPTATFRWRGEAAPEVGAGAICSATIEIIPKDGGLPAYSRHVQRHRPIAEVVNACAAAGLECVAVHGQLTGGLLDDHADELVHPKIVFIAKRAGRR